MDSLFTYGSLMCEDIMFHVAGECDVVGAASLADYRCAAVVDEEYPAIVKAPGNVTRGVVYTKITNDGFKQLDAFEGEMYARVVVSVTKENGAFTDVFTYVFKPAFHHLLSVDDWRFDHFLASGKSNFVQKYVGFSKIG